VYRCFQLTVPSYPKSDDHECIGLVGTLYEYVPVNRPSPVTAGAVCSTAIARILIDQHGLNAFYCRLPRCFAALHRPRQ